MKTSNERGNAILIAVIISALIAGLATSLSMISYTEHKTTSSSMEREIAFNIVEAAVANAMNELNANRDYDSNGIGNSAGSISGGTYTVNASFDALTNEYTLTATSTYQNMGRKVVVVVARAEQDLNVNARAAITANGPVTTLGTITVDGRDWNADNTAVIGPGVDGVSTRSTVTVGGSSSCGGNGIAPITGAVDASGVYEENANWSDSIDNDGDGLIDEETFDGIDNDGDGLIDEDRNNSYPNSPDIAMNLPLGTLENTARAQGSYIPDAAAYSAFLAANGGELPGGKVIFLDFDSLIPADLGPAMNADPSIVVMHNNTGSALMKNLHGQFKGLILADDVVHINGDALILGALQSFTPSTVGNTYGNGSAIVRFSSEVLMNLPGVITGQAYYEMKSWREISTAQ